MGRRRRLPSEPVTVEIESLSQDGRGVTHIDGKALFVAGALPGERVVCRYTRAAQGHDEAVVEEVLSASPERVVPRCEHFGVCGGCSLQHLEAGAQIRSKQQALLDAFEHIGCLEPERILDPLVGLSPWGYRRKARLGVRFVRKKGRVLVGFRERASSFVTDVTRCHVLHPKVGELIHPLAALIADLSVYDQIPQIEVAMGDSLCVLVFRVLAEPSVADRGQLREFAERYGLTVCLQPGGPDTVATLDGSRVLLDYTLPAFGLTLRFLPTDFTQVNTEVNRLMVARALELLDPDPGDRVLDLFCGLGNFTLPLAKSCADVVGVEGDPGLVARARDNAQKNHLRNARFYTANLYEALDAEPWLREAFGKALLDPPRSGALEMTEWLPRLGVERLVYVSCHPGTLARDAGELVKHHGYRLQAAGVVDMFPHTAHVESIALLRRA